MQYVAGSKFVPADPIQRAEFNEKMRVAKQVRAIVKDNPTLDDHMRNDGTKAELQRVQAGAAAIKQAKQEAALKATVIANCAAVLNKTNAILTGQQSLGTAGTLAGISDPTTLFVADPTAAAVKAELQRENAAFAADQQKIQLQNYIQTMNNRMDILKSVGASLQGNSSNSGTSNSQDSTSDIVQNLIDSQAKLAQIGQIQQLLAFMHQLSNATENSSTGVAGLTGSNSLTSGSIV